MRLLQSAIGNPFAMTELRNLLSPMVQTRSMSDHDVIHQVATQVVQGQASLNHTGYVSVVIKDGATFETTLVGDGECVAYVKKAGGFTTATPHWKGWDKVVDTKSLSAGTAIMLADSDGNYPKGASPKHAAEFVGFTDGGGIQVRDQWAARFDKDGNQTRPDQPVHTRILQNLNGKGKNPIADASKYYILMIPIAH